MTRSESCDVIILDMATGAPAFVVQLYGVSAHAMMCVPPPISVREVLRKRGIDPDRYVSSIFHVRPAKGHR